MSFEMKGSSHVRTSGEVFGGRIGEEKHFYPWNAVKKGIPITPQIQDRGQNPENKIWVHVSEHQWLTRVLGEVAVTEHEGTKEAALLNVSTGSLCKVAEVATAEVIWINSRQISKLMSLLTD